MSYDDGPSAETTPRLLDLLADNAAPATFFVLGRHAAAEPELILRLLQDGHEVGGHTQDHLNAWKVSPLSAARDVRAGLATLERLGVPTRLFRPPFGKLTAAGLLDGTFSGLRFGFWTVDSRDSWRPRPVPEVISLVKADGGGVVLMHDFAAPGRGAAPDQHSAYVLDLTKRLIEFARTEGFELLRLGDLAREAERSAN